jgi:hypothetical protein
MKIVIFDLDETLGYFVELGMFWDGLIKTTGKRDFTQEEFNDILELYPEFIRPNVENILNYLKKKKQTRMCHKIMIYTNNQGPAKWSDHILSYFETKTKSKLFDQTIRAFKINGKQVEINRTTHDKSFKDLVRCTQIPRNAQICFLDDIYHPEMANDNVYYINLKPYTHDIPFDDLVGRFVKSKIGQTIVGESNTIDVANKLLSELRKIAYTYIEKTREETEIDQILGKEIMTHLKIFFNQPQPKTARRKRKPGAMSRKMSTS